MCVCVYTSGFCSAHLVIKIIEERHLRSEVKQIQGGGEQPQADSHFNILCVCNSNINH